MFEIQFLQIYYYNCVWFLVLGLCQVLEGERDQLGQPEEALLLPRQAQREQPDVPSLGQIL